MNLSRCERGHFYDREKYPSCPHCEGGRASDDTLTSAFTVDSTQENVFDPNPAPVSGFPEANLPADQVTMPMDIVGGESLTVPLVNLDSPGQANSGNQSTDDDHTVGFFESDLFGDETMDPSALSDATSKSVSNKVSTPCVGWLIALGGAHIGTDFRLKAGKNFVGRSTKMDVALTDDQSVSRDKHAIVVYEPKAHLYLVQPGEASTLVYKNNEVVLSPVKLEAYDVITVGEVNLLFMPLCNKEFNWTDLLDELKNKNSEK